LVLDERTWFFKKRTKINKRAWWRHKRDNWQFIHFWWWFGVSDWMFTQNIRILNKQPKRKFRWTIIKSKVFISL